MASIIKVDNVQNTPGTNIINKCSVTTTIGAGAGDTINVCAATVNLGRCGGTVALACGATQTGFGRTGTVDWVTTVKVTGDSPITAVTGEGYFLNTTAGTITINLPAGAAGSIVSMADYARTWDTNNVTVAANGSEKIGGIAGSATLSTEGQSVTFVYIDGTQGWVNIQDSTSAVIADTYMTATGGTPCAGATCGDYKIHTFTGPGTFCVASLGTIPANNVVDYMVVASGGGGGGYGGAGGAGGYRESVPPSGWTGSPVAKVGNARPVTASPYSIAVGAAGTAATPGNAPQGGDGNTSTFSDISSTGGGGGAGNTNPTRGGRPGGSGGGGSRTPGCAADAPVATGNTPPFSPPQGNPGAIGYSDNLTFTTMGGGGGALLCSPGGAGTPTTGGDGGSGAGTEINPSPTYGTPGPSGPLRYFGGGGAGGTDNSGKSTGCGGVGGGGDGAAPPAPSANNGADNTGGGAGGGVATKTGAGGSGIVILRYKFQ